ncbi:uncharacterized protein IUM83_11104 [Phytophthora cinnamomi]|uniref:uncharacterized protein n=1 Tax=Phytophthora cinnamomi TaxID=4785 RepID=UPI002A291A09|nr:hypothetical protein IUM83_11104 [Phytophthora cinnamomi]KAJ8515444.1 hypothetical protein ON010_g18559 [Phytophthora cinnamomi]
MHPSPFFLLVLVGLVACYTITAQETTEIKSIATTVYKNDSPIRNLKAATGDDDAVDEEDEERGAFTSLFSKASSLFSKKQDLFKTLQKDSSLRKCLSKIAKNDPRLAKVKHVVKDSNALKNPAVMNALKSDPSVKQLVTAANEIKPSKADSKKFLKIFGKNKDGSLTTATKLLVGLGVGTVTAAVLALLASTTVNAKK